MKTPPKDPKIACAATPSVQADEVERSAFDEEFVVYDLRGEMLLMVEC